MGLGFLLALLTAENTPLKKLTRAVIFLPVVIGLAVSSLLWFWLFDQQVGLLNKFLVDIGLLSEPITWFTNADLALWAIIWSITWKVVGFGMILFVASIQSIDEEIIEAATIDGASYWQRVLRIVLPLTLKHAASRDAHQRHWFDARIRPVQGDDGGQPERPDLHLGLLGVPELLHFLQTRLRGRAVDHTDGDHPLRRRPPDHARAAGGEA